MTISEKELTKDHIHSLTQDQLEEGMHQLARVIGAEHEMGDRAEEIELQEIINLDMDEIFERRRTKLSS